MTKPRKIEIDNDFHYPGKFDLDDVVTCIKPHPTELFVVGGKYTVSYSKFGPTDKKTHDWLVIGDSGVLINHNKNYAYFELAPKFEIGDIIVNIESSWKDVIKGDMGEVVGMKYVKDKDRDDWLLSVRWLKNDSVCDFYAPYAKLVERKEVKPPAPKKIVRGDWGFD